MYDENGDLIAPEYHNQEDDTDETTDAHEQEDQEEETDLEAILEENRRLKAQNDKLKANKIKNIVKHKQGKDETLSKLERLEAIIMKDQESKIESEAKSIYADADAKQVNDLVKRGLSVKQAVHALYGDEIVSKPKPTVSIQGRPATPSTGGKGTPTGFEYRDKGMQARWLEKNS